MKSSLPKVLHPVLGRPILDWVLRSVKESGATSVCLVLSEDLAGFEEYLSANPKLRVAIQSNRLGTGDAVASAAFAIRGVPVPSYAAGRLHKGEPLDAGYVLVCAGDVPGMRSRDLAAFVKAALANEATLAVLGMEVPDPTGYGRLVTRSREGVLELEAIVEEKDADEKTRAIKLCNTGVIFAKASELFHLLDGITRNNSQNEYYLTDCFELARKRGISTYVHVAPEWRDFAGVNTPEQLRAVEEWLSERGEEA